DPSTLPTYLRSLQSALETLGATDVLDALLPALPLVSSSRSSIVRDISAQVEAWSAALASLSPDDSLEEPLGEMVAQMQLVIAIANLKSTSSKVPDSLALLCEAAALLGCRIVGTPRVGALPPGTIDFLCVVLGQLREAGAESFVMNACGNLHI